MTVRAPAGPAAREAVPWPDVVLLVLVGGVALHPLAVFWSGNSDYAFGWGVPVLAAYLALERWPGRPVRRLETAGGSRVALVLILVVWTLLLLLGRMLTETEPGWRPALWLVMSLYAGGVLAWAGLYGGGAWVRYFAFPAAFLFLGVPWIFNVELPVVQGLMRLNAALVADSLVLLDIPARAQGNTILLTTGTLNVAEACSGIRSLQAGLMMSVFLGEFYRLSWGRRMALPVLAVLLALAGNYGRLLFLAGRGAGEGLSSAEALHDSAGFTLLTFTVAGLWAVSLGLRGPAKREIRREVPRDSLVIPRPARAARWALGLLLAALFAEGFTQFWYAWREETAPRFADWTLALPTGAKDFRPISIPLASHRVLDDAAARTGAWTDPHGWSWQAFWFRYRPAVVNKIVLDSHNPEICLPGEGWREVRDEGETTHTVRGRVLPIRGYLFSTGVREEYVFWIAYRDRGYGAESTQRQGLYGRSPGAFFQRALSWGRDAWEGCRGTDAETLEVAISGPEDTAVARGAYLAFLDTAVVAEPAALSTGTQQGILDRVLRLAAPVP